MAKRQQQNRVFDDFKVNAAFEREILDGNDRAAVLVGMAMIDAGLLDLLLAAMAPSVEKGEDELVRRGQGPLATLSAKIDLGYRLRLITEAARSVLHGMRDIRNGCRSSEYTWHLRPLGLVSDGEQHSRGEVHDGRG